MGFKLQYDKLVNVNKLLTGFKFILPKTYFNGFLKIINCFAEYFENSKK